MKYSLLLCVVLASCSSYQIVSISPNSSQLVENTSKDPYSKIFLTNKSNQELEVGIVNNADNEATSGFGINKKGNVEVTLSSEQNLKITNPSDKKIKVRYISQSTEAPQRTAVEYVSFTLRNNSANSIPLLIPTVMNPNLSPYGNSGVDLKVGQEILFKVNGKKYILFTVDSSYANKTIDVATVLKERKKELGL